MQVETSMENENEMVIKRLSVPLGLEELMENLTKEVLRRRPTDVYAFASEHFAQLLALRDTGCYKTSFMKIKKTPSQVSAESLKETQGAKPPPIKIKSAMLGTMETAPKSLGNRKKNPSPRSKSITSDSPVLRSDRAKQILDKHMAKKQSASDKSKIEPKGKAAVKADGQRKSGSKKATPQKDVEVKRSAKQVKALQTGEKRSQTKNDKAPPLVEGGGLKRSETETPKGNESEVLKGNETKTHNGNETGTPRGNEIETPTPRGNEIETPKGNENQNQIGIEIPGANESETPKENETKTPRESEESDGPKEEALPKMENAIGEEFEPNSKKETVGNIQELKREVSEQLEAKTEADGGTSDISKTETDDAPSMKSESENQENVESEPKVINKEETENRKLNDETNNDQRGNKVKEDARTETEKVHAVSDEKQEDESIEDRTKEMANATENNLKSSVGVSAEAQVEAQEDEKQMGIAGDEASEQNRTNASKEKIENAAISIQAGWRGYQTRKRLQKTVEPTPGDLVNVAEREDHDRKNDNSIQDKKNEQPGTLLRQETVTISKDSVTEELGAKSVTQTQLAPKTAINLEEDAKSCDGNEAEKLEESGDTTISQKEENEMKQEDINSPKRDKGEEKIGQKEVEILEPQNHLATMKTEEDYEGSEDVLAKSTNAAVKIQAYVRGHLARQKSIYRNNSDTNLMKSSSANDENNNDEKKATALPAEASENFRKTFVETISESDHDEVHPVNEGFDQTKAKELTRAFVENEQRSYEVDETPQPNKGGGEPEEPKSERDDAESELSKEKPKMGNLGKSRSPVFGRAVEVDSPAIEKLALAPNNVENAAVKIQSLWRGHVIRRNLELKNLQKPTDCDDLPGDRLSVKDLVKAATVIQALFRGYSVRKYFKNEKMESSFRREKSFEEKLPTVLEVEDDGGNEDGPKVKAITTSNKEVEEAKKLSDEEIVMALENVPLPPKTPDTYGRSSAGTLRRSKTPLKKNLSVSDLHTKSVPEEADFKEKHSDLDIPLKAEESDIHEDIAEITNSIKEDVVKLKQVLGDEAIPKSEESNTTEDASHLLQLASSMKEDAQKLQETLSNETRMTEEDQPVSKSEGKAIPNEDFGKVKKPSTSVEDDLTTNKEKKPEKTIPNEDSAPIDKGSIISAEDDQTTNKSEEKTIPCEDPRSVNKESTTAPDDDQTTTKSEDKQEKSIPNEDPELLSRPVSKESTTSADSVDTVIFNDQKPRKKPTRADTILPENYIQDNLETSMQNLSLDQFDEVSSGSNEDKQVIPVEEEAPPKKLLTEDEEPPIKYGVKFRVLGELKEDSGENEASSSSEREKRLGEVKEQSSDLVTDVIDTAAKKIQKFFRQNKGKGRRKSASTTAKILKQTDSVRTQSTLSSSEDDKDTMAATTIQKTYRGYRVRRDLQNRKTPLGEDNVEYDKKEKEIDREITNLLKSITAPVRRAFSADDREKVEAKEKVADFKEEGDEPNYVYIPLRDYSSEDSQELVVPSKSRAGSKVDIYMPHFAASEDASNDSRTESHSEGTSTSKNVTTSEYSAEDISDKCKSIENKIEFEQKGVKIEDALEKAIHKEEPKSGDLKNFGQTKPIEEDEQGVELEEVKDTAKVVETQQEMKEEDKILEDRNEQKMIDETQKPPKEEKQTNEGIANAAITQYINSLIEPIKQAFSADKNKPDRRSGKDIDVRPSTKDEGPIYIPLRDYSDESPDQPSSSDELGFRSDRKKREVLLQDPTQKLTEEPNSKALEQPPDSSQVELIPDKVDEIKHPEQPKRAQSLNDLESQILNELGLTEGEPECENEANFEKDQKGNPQSESTSEEAKVSNVKDQLINNGAKDKIEIEKLNGMEEESGKNEETKGSREFQGQSLTQSAKEISPNGNSTVKEEALDQNDPNAKLLKADVSRSNEVNPKHSPSASHGTDLEKSSSWKVEGDQGNEMEATFKAHKVELVEDDVVKENVDDLTMETKKNVEVVRKNGKKENNEEQKKESASVDGKSISRETDEDSVQGVSSKKGNINEVIDDNQAIDGKSTSPVTLPSKTDQVASSISNENERKHEENSSEKVKEEKKGSSKKNDNAIDQKEGKTEDVRAKPVKLEEDSSTEVVQEERGKGNIAREDSSKGNCNTGVGQNDEAAQSTDKRGEEPLGLKEDIKTPAETCKEKEESTSSERNDGTAKNGNEKLNGKAQGGDGPQREMVGGLSEMQQNEDVTNAKGKNDVTTDDNQKEEKVIGSEQPKQSVEAVSLVPSKIEEAANVKQGSEETAKSKDSVFLEETLAKLESQIIIATPGENADNKERNKNAQALDNNVLGMPISGSTDLCTENDIKKGTIQNEKSPSEQNDGNENNLKSAESEINITDPKLESVSDTKNSQQQNVKEEKSKDNETDVEVKVKNEIEENQNLKPEETKLDTKEDAVDKTENVKADLTPEEDLKLVDTKSTDSNDEAKIQNADEVNEENSELVEDIQARSIQKEDQQHKIEETCEKKVLTALGEEREEDLTQPSQKGDRQNKIEETREEKNEDPRSLDLADDKKNARPIENNELQSKSGEPDIKNVTTAPEEERKDEKSSDLTKPIQKDDQQIKITDGRKEEREEQRSLDLAEVNENTPPIRKDEQQSKIEETREEEREEQRSLDLAEAKETARPIQNDEQQSKIEETGMESVATALEEGQERVEEKSLDLAAEVDLKGKDLKGELETSDLTSKKGQKIEESYMGTIKEEEEVKKGEAASREDTKALDQKDNDNDKKMQSEDEETSANSTENAKVKSETAKSIEAEQHKENLEDDGHEIKSTENKTRDDLAKKERKIEEDPKQKNVTENLAQAQTLPQSPEASHETQNRAKDNGSVKLEGDGDGINDDSEETTKISTTKLDLAKEESKREIDEGVKQDIVTENLAQGQILLQSPEEVKRVDVNETETHVLAPDVKGDDLGETAKISPTELNGELKKEESISSSNLENVVTSQFIEENKSIAPIESNHPDALVIEGKAKDDNVAQIGTCLQNSKVERGVKDGSPADKLDAVVKEEGKRFGESFDLDEIAKNESRNDEKEFTEEKKTEPSIVPMESKVNGLTNQAEIEQEKQVEGANQQLISKKIPEGVGQEITPFAADMKEDEGKSSARASEVEAREEDNVLILKNEKATMLDGFEENMPVSSIESREIQPKDNEGVEDKLQGDSGNQSGATENIPERTVQVTDGPQAVGEEEGREDVASTESVVQATQISASESSIKGTIPSNGAEKTPAGSLEPEGSELDADEMPKVQGDSEKIESTPVSSTESREIQPSIDEWPKENEGEEDKLQGDSGNQSGATENIPERTVQVTDGPKAMRIEEGKQDVTSVESLVQATQISESESPTKGTIPSNGAEKAPAGSLESKGSELHVDEMPKEKDSGKIENIPERIVQVTDSPKTEGKEERREDVASIGSLVQATQISESSCSTETPAASIESNESELQGEEKSKEKAGVQGESEIQLDTAEDIPGKTVQVTDGPKTEGKEEGREDVASIGNLVQATQISESSCPIEAPAASIESKESELRGEERSKEKAEVQGESEIQLDAAEDIPGKTVQVTGSPKTEGKEEGREDVASIGSLVQATQISESSCPIETPAASIESKENELQGEERAKEKSGVQGESEIQLDTAENIPGKTVQVTGSPKIEGKEEKSGDVTFVDSLVQATQISDSESPTKDPSTRAEKTPSGSMESKESKLHGDERPKEKAGEEDKSQGDSGNQTSIPQRTTLEVTTSPKTAGEEEGGESVASIDGLVHGIQISESKASIKGKSPSNFAGTVPAGLMELKESDERPRGKAGAEDELPGNNINQSGATENVPKGTAQATNGLKAAEEVTEKPGSSIKGKTPTEKDDVWPKEVSEEDKQQDDGEGESDTTADTPKATAEEVAEESVDSLDATIKLEDKVEAFQPESIKPSESVPEVEASERSAPFYLHQDSYSKSPTTLQEKAFAEALKNASSDVGKAQTEEGERLLHSGEFHDSIPLKVSSGKAAAMDATAQPRPPPPLAHSGELHDNIIPLVLQMNDAPAGTEAVTSGREASVSVGAQASDKDVSAAREDAPDTTQQHSQPSSGMDTEKRNNSAIVRKSMEAEAATKIQASFRGYQVRKQLKGRNTGGAISSNRRSSRRKSSGRISDSKRAALQNKTNPSQLEQESATKIQAGIRGFLVRRRQKKEKKNIKKTPESG